MAQCWRSGLKSAEGDAASGKLLTTWGENRFVILLGLTVDHEGNLRLTDVGLHQVFNCAVEGKVLRTIGEAGVPSSDRAHFKLSTDVAVLPDGSFYLRDGYKITRIVDQGGTISVSPAAALTPTQTSAQKAQGSRSSPRQRGRDPARRDRRGRCGKGCLWRA